MTPIICRIYEYEGESRAMETIFRLSILRSVEGRKRSVSIAIGTTGEVVSCRDKKSDTTHFMRSAAKTKFSAGNPCRIRSPRCCTQRLLSLGVCQLYSRGW